MTDLVTVTITKALRGAGYESVHADIEDLAGKVLRSRRLVPAVATTVAGMTDWDLVRIMKDGTLTFVRWSPEGDCELLATTPAGILIAQAQASPRCLDWFLAAAAEDLHND